MCTRGLPGIYTLSPRACGPRASGVYIRQTTRAHGITTKYIYIDIYIYIYIYIYTYSYVTFSHLRSKETPVYIYDIALAVEC